MRKGNEHPRKIKVHEPSRLKRHVVFHHHLIDRLAIAAGIFSGIALYPQVIYITTAGTLDGVSLPTYTIIFINSFVWLAYSIHRGLISLGIAAILNIIASGTVLAWFALI
jgi:uncharacterized protein with PQ loop repeat